MSKMEDAKVYIEWLNKIVKDFPSFGNILSSVTKDDADFWTDFQESKATDSRYDGLEFYSGMSRGVFVSENCDYVIKFALNSRGEEDCEREVTIYKAAKERGLNFMFAEVDFGFVYRGKKFYICERADADEDYAIERSASYSGRSVEEIDGGDFESIRDIFYSFYAYNYVNDFINFCDEWDINDIHANNIGFDGETLKCIDYAGF